MYQWSEGEVVLAASGDCDACHGLGIAADSVVCECVYMHIFDECADYYCESKSVVTQDGNMWGRPREEFRADFELIARDVLDEVLWSVFNLYFLHGYSVPQCLRKLEMNQRAFYRNWVTARALCGQAFQEWEPYGIYPLQAYLGHGMSRKRAQMMLRLSERLTYSRTEVVDLIADERVAA